MCMLCYATRVGVIDLASVKCACFPETNFALGQVSQRVWAVETALATAFSVPILSMLWLLPI